MILSESPKIEIIHGDCMDYMKNLANKTFSVALVDPPYGEGFDRERESMTISPNMSPERRYAWSERSIGKYKKKSWDKVPPKGYFIELFRISKNQIICGGNHFELPQSRGWVFWDKRIPANFSLADGELIWTSYDKAVKKFVFLWSGFLKAKKVERIHPTQKPVDLYKFLFKNYIKEGDTVIDTHLGSGSSAIASYEFGNDFTGLEIDDDYYKDSIKRVKKFISEQKPSLFKARDL
jgi:site-specific DNA-methyltransferase (adenine-specific)